MSTSKVSAIALFALATLSCNASAEYWRVALTTGQSGVVKIDKYIFEGGRDGPSAYSITNLSEGKYEFTLGSGLFTPRLPFSEISGFQFKNCKGGDQGRDSWMTCDVVVNMKNGEQTKRDTGNPWFLGRLVEGNKWGGTLRSFSGTLISDNGKLEPIQISMGWSDTVGTYRNPRVINKIDFLTDDEGKAFVSHVIDKLPDLFIQNNYTKFSAIFEELATGEQKERFVRVLNAAKQNKQEREARKKFNATPLEMEIGVEQRAQVISELGEKIGLYTPDFRYVNGIIGCEGRYALKGEPDKVRSLNISGLSNVMFCFDEKNTLIRVNMELAGNKTEVLDSLSAKYQLVSKNERQGDYGTFIDGAVYKLGKSIVEFAYDGRSEFKNARSYFDTSNISLSYKTDDIYKAEQDRQQRFKQSQQDRAELQKQEQKNRNLKAF